MTQTTTLEELRSSREISGKVVDQYGWCVPNNLLGSAVLVLDPAVHLRKHGGKERQEQGTLGSSRDRIWVACSTWHCYLSKREVVHLLVHFCRA